MPVNVQGLSVKDFCFIASENKKKIYTGLRVNPTIRYPEYWAVDGREQRTRMKRECSDRRAE